MLAKYFFLLPIISWGLTGILRQYALQKKVLDIPNSRSSHTIPTPRGGGIAFVIPFLVFLCIFASFNLIPLRIFWGTIISSAIIAVLGYWDDCYSLSAKLRLVGHFVAAFVLVQACHQVLFVDNPVASIIFFSSAIIYVVWCINLFNFMDGIDGIASIQIITVCTSGAALNILVGDYPNILLPCLLILSVFGFLLWNFPPAKIFMGDVGSGFLGLLISLFSLIAFSTSISLFYAWFILNGVFFCDASLTLIKRTVKRENIFEAHCNHAYQFAARKFGHRAVTIATGIINIFWLLPWAYLVVQGKISGLTGITVSFLSLMLLYYVLYI